MTEKGLTFEIIALLAHTMRLFYIALHPLIYIPQLTNTTEAALFS